MRVVQRTFMTFFPYYFMSHLTQKLFIDAVGRFGWKMTPQRKTIVNFIAKSTTHPTAEDVFYYVSSEFPMTSRATIYNTLHLLCSHDLLTELSVGGLIRFDPRLSSHHHFICDTCDLVRDIPDGVLILSIHPDYEGIKTTSMECDERGTCEEYQLMSPAMKNSVAL